MCVCVQVCCVCTSDSLSTALIEISCAGTSASQSVSWRDAPRLLPGCWWMMRWQWKRMLVCSCSFQEPTQTYCNGTHLKRHTPLSYLFFTRRMATSTSRMKTRTAALMPAIFTTWSVCLAGSGITSGSSVAPEWKTESFYFNIHPYEC